MRTKTKGLNWGLATLLVLALVGSAMLLAFTFYHTGNLLSQLVRIEWLGYVAAGGIELSILTFSILRAMGFVKGHFAGFALTLVLMISAVAQVISGYETYYDRKVTWLGLLAVDPAIAIAGVLVTAMLPLMVFFASETLARGWVDIAAALQSSTQKANRATRLTPVNNWPENDRPVTYYMQGDRADAVKIGTSFNVPKRARDLQVGVSAPLVLAAWEYGEQEKARHEQFARSHIRGEWFLLDDALRAHIAQLASEVHEAANPLNADVSVGNLEQAEQLLLERPKMTERELASLLGVSASTAHTYMKRLRNGVEK